MEKIDTLIVGAGVAGLSAAVTLQKAGASFVVLEASDAVGGRVRSDRVEGFTLDRGFQVLLTAYPTCRTLLDYPALQLGAFDPGALIHIRSRDHRFSDPFRRPLEGLASLAAPVGSLADKWRIARLRHAVLSEPIDAAWTSPNQPTHDFLRERGFSPTMVEAFFRPFFSGIFLEKELVTSARMFSFVFRCFSEGVAALPAGGMGRLPEQLAKIAGLDRIRLQSRVVEVAPGSITLASGSVVQARSIILAVDGDQSASWFSDFPKRSWNGGVSYYYDASASPLRGKKLLWLNGSGKGRINHVAVPSDVAEGYAPPGRSLVCVNTVGDAKSPADPEHIQREAVGNFGPSAAGWRLLGVRPVVQALPDYTPDSVERLRHRLALPSGIFLCGDALGAGSLETAMASGMAAAEAALST
ncbi:MAG TPA: NAD(P)/FAD-dependent oxidoreductase [Kiritimatiellia bacterium]|nr:NAD(P)/FAD-dependent oxidoreductase [Kiritimatiellia bacterium]HMP00255.1 NAD(P)/FAD-dependent oxidoreductase [Kiritimatiellia bacterium]HMP97846.1 NAD(P)/FAD-dependent oxidoreductase [Kiritimatiellia bacterium]